MWQCRLSRGLRLRLCHDVRRRAEIRILLTQDQDIEHETVEEDTRADEGQGQQAVTQLSEPLRSLEFKLAGKSRQYFSQ